MIQYLLVWLSLSVLQRVVVFGIWRKVVAGFEMGEIALDVARGTGASWSCETDVGRHGEYVAAKEIWEKKMSRYSGV